MHTSIVIPVLLGAGALAHPHFKLNNPLAHVHHKRQEPVRVVTTTIGNQVIVEDIYVQTIHAGGSPPAASITPVVAPNRIVVPVDTAPNKLQVVPVNNNNNGNNDLNNDHNSVPVRVTSTTPAPEPTHTSVAPAPVSTSAAPVQSSQPSGGNDGAPVSDGQSILETANKYRSLMGFPEYTYSSKLATNAAKTNKASGANSMVHQLNPGSMGQCISQGDDTKASGDYSPFELTYLGWLCEISDSRLGGACDVMLKATHMVIDSTGHAEILRDRKYTEIGCNYMDSTQETSYKGLWTCDFA